ncbi:MAG TPA: response regulator, partial [Candidatus Limnocylindrales bacterium]|nr:response regulator [Candidatus Limnocylindrales bacterium]
AVRDSIVRLLRARRFRAIGAVDGRDALRRAFAESARLDLVVTEASLPDMTGVELVARLRAARPETRIVLTTADPEIAAQAPERLGVDGVLVKPFPASDAVALVERLLGEGATGATEPGEESVDS